MCKLCFNLGKALTTESPKKILFSSERTHIFSVKFSNEK